MIEDILINLDKEKIYCQKCLLENKIIPLSISESSGYIKTECSHTGRNCNTFRFHNNEWHLFYGFLKDAKCRTCHAKKNLEKMNDPNGEIRQKLNEWYKTDKCKKILKNNTDKWRNSQEGKLHAIRNTEKWRSSEIFKTHGADGLKQYIKTKEFQKHIKQHNQNNCEKLNNLSYKFCEKCNEDTLHNGFGTCSVCNPNIIKQSFVEKHGQLYYLDQKEGNYVLWEDFKKKFSLKNKNIDDFTAELKNKYPNLLIIPTFRSQESVDWCGARSAFEQNLVDEKITWFAYIKFYIDKQNNVKPLVVGKSGSLLVNSVGSDISFSEDENHGPARKFLLDNNLKWDKTQVLVIPCNNESEALKNELNIQIQYNLFGS